MKSIFLIWYIQTKLLIENNGLSDFREFLVTIPDERKKTRFLAAPSLMLGASLTLRLGMTLLLSFRDPRWVEESLTSFNVAIRLRDCFGCLRHPRNDKVRGSLAMTERGHSEGPCPERSEGSAPKQSLTSFVME